MKAHVVKYISFFLRFQVGSLEKIYYGIYLDHRNNESCCCVYFCPLVAPFLQIFVMKIRLVLLILFAKYFTDSSRSAIFCIDYEQNHWHDWRNTETSQRHPTETSNISTVQVLKGWIGIEYSLQKKSTNSQQKIWFLSWCLEKLFAR